MGTETFYIETYGCASNKADSTIMAELLRRAGYERTSLEDASFLIINTCAVKEQTENRIIGRLKTLQKVLINNKDKHLIIAGCLPHITRSYIAKVKRLVPNFAAIIDLDNIDDIVVIFEKIKQGSKNLVLKTSDSIDKAKFLITPSKDKITGIVPISEGCLGSCTYCCVKNARGRLYCYDPENILNNVRHLVKRGVKQVYLTSQDCSTYEFNDTNLASLVNSITGLSGTFFLRIGMINPAFIKNHLDQILEIFPSNNLYQFLHVPIQSGSNRILKVMQRPYRISDIIDPFDQIRERFPDMTISTDVICGFPGETEHDFLQTINFLKWLKPEIMNISKFTARPGTKAKKMEQLSSKTIKERSIRLSNVFRNCLKTLNEKWVGWEGEILILKQGTDPNQWFGRNFAYKNVLIKDKECKRGEYVRVRINRVERYNLHAEVV